MVTFINKVNKVIIEEYVSRFAIQKRDRSLNKPRGLKLTKLNPDKRYLFQFFRIYYEEKVRYSGLLKLSVPTLE